MNWDRWDFLLSPELMTSEEVSSHRCYGPCLRYYALNVSQINGLWPLHACVCVLPSRIPVKRESIYDCHGGTGLVNSRECPRGSLPLYRLSLSTINKRCATLLLTSLSTQSGYSCLFLGA